jgi:hypothetical protein
MEITMLEFKEKNFVVIASTEQVAVEITASYFNRVPHSTRWHSLKNMSSFQSRNVIITHVTTLWETNCGSGNKFLSFLIVLFYLAVSRGFYLWIY